ncbi:MAG: hypothetical protein GX214_02695 [Clostridiales bacterium]|nr:hypothetical protein [Clostridiales bacterium]
MKKISTSIFLIFLFILSLFLMTFATDTMNTIVHSNRNSKIIRPVVKTDIDINDEDIHNKVEEIGKKFVDALLVWDEEVLLEITDPYIIEMFNKYPKLRREFSISKQALNDYDFTIESIDENLKIVGDMFIMDIHQLVSMKSKEPSFTGNYNRYKYDYKISVDINPYNMKIEEVTWDVVPIRLQIN